MRCKYCNKNETHIIGRTFEGLCKSHAQAYENGQKNANELNSIQLSGQFVLKGSENHKVTVSNLFILLTILSKITFIISYIGIIIITGLEPKLENPVLISPVVYGMMTIWLVGSTFTMVNYSADVYHYLKLVGKK